MKRDVFEENVSLNLWKMNAMKFSSVAIADDEKELDVHDIPVVLLVL